MATTASGLRWVPIGRAMRPSCSVATERWRCAVTGNVSRRARRYGALAAVTVLTACSWFTDFKEQPKIDPWESPDTVSMRANPQSSVPVYGTFAPGYAVSRAALPGTIDSMASIPNPIPADARPLPNGPKDYP